MRRQTLVSALAAAFVLIGSATAVAQEVVTATLVNVPQQFRDPETWISPTVQRENIPEAQGRFRIRLVMTAADELDESITLQMELYEFIPEGTPNTQTGWKLVTGGPWKCGPHINPDTGEQEPPSISFHPSQLHPAATGIRYQVGWPKRLRLGLVVETFIEQ
jgi:hypothetical protein